MIFRPSSLNRVMKCPGSRALELQHPNDSGEAAKEGTLAHEYAAMVLQYGVKINTLDSEMREAVEMYVKFCKGFTGHKHGVEEHHEIEIGGAALSGTCDFFAWTPDNTLIIVDFKYGFGWVEAIDNWQLIAYAVLMWLKHGNGTMPTMVQLYVVQPRANHPQGPIRKFEFNGELLRNYMNQIENGVSAAMLPNAKTKTGSHCRYCRAQLGCYANWESVSHIIEAVGASGHTELGSAEVARELDLLTEASKRVKYRLEVLEAHAIERIKAGEGVKGWSASQTMSALKWDDPPEVAAKPGEYYTPLQTIKQGLMPEEEVKKRASRKLGAFKLKRVDMKHVKEIIKNAN